MNIGGKQIYKFAKSNNKVKPISAKKKFGKNFPTKQSMKVDKFMKIIKI